MKPSQKINRRSFINKATTLVVGACAFSATASSYNQISGANDRISLGHIGVERRGKELAGIVAKLKEKNVEMTAVCDLCKINREAAAAQATKDYQKAPRAFQYMEELLALKDLNAVLVSTSFSRIMGKAATTLVNIGGEGSPRWKWIEEKSTDDNNPSNQRNEKYITLQGVTPFRQPRSATMTSRI